MSLITALSCAKLKNTAPPPTKGSINLLIFSGFKTLIISRTCVFPPTHLTKGFNLILSSSISYLPKKLI